MTTRALVKSSNRDPDEARAALAGHAKTAEGTIGGRTVHVTVEPLLRRDAGGAGARRQSLRLSVDGETDNRPLGEADVTVTTSSGQPVSIRTIPGPYGSTRVLIPAVDDSVTVDVGLSHLDPAETIRVPVSPQREWTVHLVHHSHLDIGYTDPQGTVLGEHVNFLDSCLDLTKSTEQWPDDAQFRWAVESLWSFDQWRRARPQNRIDEFLERVHDGHIELTAMPYNLHTDACSTDELHELLHLAREVQRRYGVNFTTAMQTDVPGTVAGLPDALAQLDVRYLSVAHNWAGRSVPHLNGGANLPRLFRWRSPAGNELLVWMTDSPHGLAYMEGPMLGFNTSYNMVDDLLPAYLTSLAINPYPFPGHIFGWSHAEQSGERDPYPWDVVHLRVQGHFADNAPPRLIMAETVRQWNETWEYPHLRMSRNEDFFRDAEQRLGDRIATFEGDWGDWWVDGTGSGARPQSLMRRAQWLVTDAQTVGSFAAMTSGDHVEDERSRGVYAAMSLFNEHTWGAALPWTDGDEGMHSGDQQWHWKYAAALRSHDQAEEFLDNASAVLGGRLATDGDTLATFYAVNTSARERSGPVRLFLRESRVPLDAAVAVRDGRTGKTLPLAVTGQTNPNHRDAGRWLRVPVNDVPACGMVRLDVVAASATSEPGESHNADPLVLDNGHLRVQVDLQTACIASIVDKANGKELVNQEATVGFNGYVYDTYATAGGVPYATNMIVTTDQLDMLGSRSLARPAALISRETTALEQLVTYEFTADGVRWLRVTLRLPHDDAVLFIENRFAKPTTMTKESAYVAFPFAVSDPRVRYEITGGLTGDGLAHVPGAPQHMRAVRSWVTMEGDDGAVAWATREAHLVQPEVIALPYAPFPDSTAPREPGTLYSWVHNNLWDTNFPSQQGFEMSFHYAVGVPRAGEDVSPQALAMRTAAALTNPLVGVLATGEPVVDAAPEASLLELDDDRVRMVSVVSGEEPDHVLIRLQSFADEPTRVRVRYTAGPVRDAATATYLGDRLAPAPVNDGVAEVEIPRLGTVAILLRLARTVGG